MRQLRHYPSTSELRHLLHKCLTRGRHWHDAAALDLCDEALFSANKLISISPKDESAWELAAGAAQRLKRLDEAVSMIERAIRLIPGSAMLNYALGQLS